MGQCAAIKKAIEGVLSDMGSSFSPKPLSAAELAPDPSIPNASRVESDSTLRHKIGTIAHCVRPPHHRPRHSPERDNTDRPFTTRLGLEPSSGRRAAGLRPVAKVAHPHHTAPARTYAFRPRSSCISARGDFASPRWLLERLAIGNERLTTRS